MPQSEVEATKATSARKTRATTTKQEVKKSPRSRSPEKMVELENSKPIQQAQAVTPVPAAITNEKMANQLPAVSAQKNELNLHLSESLLKKLIATAAHEGISREDLASELIAEGIVLRAFEIAERRQAMKFNVGGHTGQSQQNGNHHRQNQGQKPNFRNGDNNSRHRRPGGGNGGGIPRRPANYNNLFEDKASFMEYVRNQEKAQR